MPDAMIRWGLRGLVVVGIATLFWLMLWPDITASLALPDIAIHGGWRFLIYAAPIALMLGCWWVIDEHRREFAEARKPSSERN